MRRRQIKLTDYGPAPGRLDVAAEWLIAALLVFMPLAFGVVEPWSEFVAAAATLALAVLLVVRRVVRTDCPSAWTWAYVPIGLYVVLVLLQLVPLPESVLRIVSPETLATRSQLLADLPAAQAAGAATPLSFYSLATRHDLRVVLLAATIFVAVVQVYRRPEQVRRLLLVVTCVGGAVAALALAQHVTRADMIYWLVATPHPLADGGPFVNHNHFAQFMNLSAGAALGLLLVKLRELGVGVDLHGSDVAGVLQEPEARAAWGYGGVFVAGVVAVFLSMSRGGMVGLLAGLTLVTVALARRQHLRGQGWVVAGLTLAAFGGLLYFGFDAVYDRVASSRNLPEATGGRWELVKGAAEVWRKFPLLGTGLGTHAFVFPAYDPTETENLAQYLENDYVQAAEETGAVGLILVLLFAGVIWSNFFRAARAHRPRVCAASFGLAFGLSAVMVQSLSDFGQHLPAVAGLSAVTCGLLVVLARMAGQVKASEAAAAAESSASAADTAHAGHAEANPAAGAAVPPAARRPRRLATAAVSVLVAVLLGWSVLDAHGARVAAADAAAASRLAGELAANGWDGSDEDYTRLLELSVAATDARPGDVEHRYWLNAYRWRAMARERDEQTGELLLTEEAVGHAARIVEELHAARPLCPTFGPLVSLAGQLELFVLDRPQGAERIALAYSLAPNHPDVVFTAALADAEGGEWTASLDKFRRCIDLTPQVLREVIDVYETQYDRPDLALAAAEHGGNPTELMQLSHRLRARGAAPEVADAAWKAGLTKLEQLCQQPDASPKLIAALATIYRDTGKPDDAVKLFRRALGLDYGQVEWRLALARILAAEEKHAEALREANICLRLRPEMPGVRELVEELTGRPAAAPATAPAPDRGSR